MNLLDRHIFKSVLLTCAGAVGLFAFVLMLGNLVRDLLPYLLSGQLPVATFLSLVWMLVPAVAIYALPMGMLTGVLLTLGRLSADSEITAMRAAGLSLAQVGQVVVLCLPRSSDVRAALFGLAGQTLARCASDELIAQLRSRLDEMDAAAKARDFDAYYPLNLAFHGFIVEAAGNPVLAAHYRDLVKRLNLFRARSLVQGGGLAVSNAEHRAMVEAVAARDPDAAREAFAAHVNCARTRLLSAESSTEKGSL